MPPGKYPTFSDYQSALQHPETAFPSNFLQSGNVESDLWGFPRVRSGGFALTYKVGIKDEAWAVRCFHRGVRDRGSRYAQISQVLEEIHLPFLEPSRYFHNGITVNRKSYPISILKWIEGESLENYVLHNLEEPNILNELADNFRKMCFRLESSGMAHGDLSHRNIIINSGEIYLIDYDGMFVPGLSGRKSCELGNIHFQHPLRNSMFFNSTLDRFPSIVIYLAIKALGSEPSLWQEFQSGGEGLLFQQADFVEPEKSKLMSRLEKSSSISKYIQKFRQVCLTPLESIPSLDEFLGRKTQKQIVQPDVFQSKRIKPYNHPVLDAWSDDLIRNSAGQMLTVIGKIRDVFHGTSPIGEEHIFVNFGDWREKCFTAVFWGQVLYDLNRYDIQVDAWPNQWMSVTGLVSVINGRPQMQIESITDLLPLASEETARLQLQTAAREGRYRKVAVLSSGFKQESRVLAASIPNQLNNTSDKSKIRNIVFSDIFAKSRNSQVESTLNLLYSNERFKDDQK
jgi:hypothetical protein